jgi:hypothetical protein
MAVKEVSYNSTKLMNKTISFKCSGPSGDLISFLPVVKTACERLDAKADIYMWLDQKAFYYPGAEHPYESMFPYKAYVWMKPLIEAQAYVNSFNIWKGEEIIVDLDKHRERMLGMPYGSILRWLGFVYPDTQCDLSKPWLEAPAQREFKTVGEYQNLLVMEQVERKILINRTSRYNKPYVTYWFLQQYEKDLMFVGLPEEHEKFNKEWGLNIPHLKVDNFLELAIAIKCCKFFLGNQSMCYAIAEAMKAPRLLEVCDFAPNVQPIGPNGWDFQFQEGLIYHFERMMKEL